MSAVITSPSPRSLEQRQQALNIANHVRSTRSRLAQDAHAGRIQVTDLLADPPAEILTMPVFKLLLMTPRWGRVKALKALNGVGVSPARTVGGLTVRQRVELADWIRRA